MNATDVENSIKRLGLSEGLACWGVGVTLMILRDLRDHSARWRVAIRVALSMAIKALETWHSLQCGSDP